MAEQELKTTPGYFQQVWDGRKTFEIRYDDRGYQRGDRLILREWDQRSTCDCDGHPHRDDCHRYTGRQVHAMAGCVIASTPSVGNRRGFVGMGYVVLAICDPVNISDTEPAIAPPLPVRDAIALVHSAHTDGGQ